MVEAMRINDTIKAAQTALLDAETELLNLDYKRKLAFEEARNIAATSGKDKAPSEAACERHAKGDAEYIRLGTEMIKQQHTVGKLKIELDYLLRMFQIAMMK